MRVIFIIACLLLIVSSSARADSTDTNDSACTQVKNVRVLNPQPIDDTQINVDTTYYVPREEVSAAGQVCNPINFEEHLTQQPTVALFKSMLVPGWGQLGNRKYIKAGLVIGLEAWLISNAIYFGRLASEERSSFEEATDPLIRDVYYARYQDQKDVRNKYRWFAGIAIFASMFDAYVDAHLSGAPDQLKERNLDFDIEPDLKGGFSASLSMSF